MVPKFFSLFCSVSPLGGGGGVPTPNQSLKSSHMFGNLTQVSRILGKVLWSGCFGDVTQVSRILGKVLWSGCFGNVTQVSRILGKVLWSGCFGKVTQVSRTYLIYKTQVLSWAIPTNRFESNVRNQIPFVCFLIY